MFSLLTGAYDSYLAPTQLNLLVIGPPGVGKTALLERLKVTQFPKRAGKSAALQEPPVPLGLALHEAFVDGGALAPSKPEADSCSETTAETNNTPKPIDPPVSTTAKTSSKAGTKPSSRKEPPKKSRFKLSICPAPQRYNNSADDQDEEFVMDGENGAAENDVVSSDTSGAQPQTGEVPATPEATRRIRSHSKEMSTDDLDLINSVEGKRMAKMESIPLDDVPNFPTLQPAQQQKQQRTTAVPSLSLLQQDDKEYNLQSKKKMLPFSKIRPTIGSNLAKVDMFGAKCHLFDVGGKMKALWERYYDDCDAVIFCWKLGEDPDAETKDEEDDNDEIPFDLSKQQEVLEEVRKAIPDDVPFLVFGHIFGNANEDLADVMYTTDPILPRYHNNLTGLCCGSAKTGVGVVSGLQWLVPLAKRQQKERLASRKEAGDRKSVV